MCARSPAVPGLWFTVGTCHTCRVHRGRGLQANQQSNYRISFPLQLLSTVSLFYRQYGGKVDGRYRSAAVTRCVCVCSKVRAQGSAQSDSVSQSHTQSGNKNALKGSSHVCRGGRSGAFLSKLTCHIKIKAKYCTCDAPCIHVVTLALNTYYKSHLMYGMCNEPGTGSSSNVEVAVYSLTHVSQHKLTIEAYAII